MATLFDEKDLERIKMSCDKKIDLVVPDDMINSDGSKKYAYVTLVMIGDLYISAAIVLAESLRKLNTKADLVVLVTPDVSYDGRKILGMYFDKVKEIAYVTVSNWRTKKQKHRKYLELVFTKFHLFNLIEYEKVLLIDADAIVLKHPDHLFSLNAPAGCFLENKDLFISYDEKGNYILPPNGRIKWYDVYCKCCPHGSLIPKEMTDRVYNDYKNSGIGGGLILLEPKKGEFESIIKDVSHGKMKYLLENKLVWPEQQYLTLRYSGRWHMIDPIFFGLQGYPHYKVLYGLQYGGDKPFVLNSKIDINTRLEFPDFILWHKYYSEILNEHPELKDSSVLAETNELHKYFKVGLKRFDKFNKKNGIKSDKTVESIAKLYHVEPNVINPEHLEYYSTDPEVQYRPINTVTLMFDDIKEYDYVEPLRRLAKYYENKENNYYNRLTDSNHISKLPLSKTRLDMYDFIDKIDMDEMMLQYAKCRENLFVITVWPLSISKLDELISFLELKGNVYYVKKISLDRNAIRNLMYWMYDEFRISSKLDFIEKKLDYIGTKYEDNKVAFIYFDNVHHLHLSGQGSKFKTELRNKMIELVAQRKDSPENNNLRGNDLIHINDYHFQTIEYSHIILNNNTIELIKKQDVRKFNDKKIMQTNLMTQTFRKWMYSNLTQLEIIRVIIMGSITLHSYGIRKSNDFDGFILNKNMELEEKELEQLLYTDLINESTKMYFADFGIPNSKYWRDAWEEKNKKIFDYTGIPNLHESVLNPRYHMYFCGLKIYTIDFELTRKILRHRKQDYADFIVMYFNYRDLLENYVYLDKNNKLQFNKKFGIDVREEDKGVIRKVKSQIDNKYSKDISSVLTDSIVKSMLI